jgi:thymidylate synthase (FAD)
MRVQVLDHGYVELVESWGSEEGIIEAARMSTGKGFQGWGPGGDDVERINRFRNTTGTFNGGNDHPDRCVCQRKEVGQFADTPHTHYTDTKRCARCHCDKYQAEIPGIGDEKLLRYLYENKHATPFEMAGLTIEVQAPIFVFREWHRHRVPFGYNEMSARYAPLPDVNYIPTVERLMINSGGSNRQAGTVSGADTLTVEVAQWFQAQLRETYITQQIIYEEALKAGVPKELARVHLPVGRYSRMRATGNLRGWLGFLTLRMAPNAQWEIRQYANVVGDLIKDRFPRTWGLFTAGTK